MNRHPAHAPHLSRRALIAASLAGTAGLAALGATREAHAQTATASPAPSKAKPPIPSAVFPFESKFTDVLGSKMHYIDIGSGDPVIFVHGIPTSSYLWRNVVPFVAPGRRVIAVDNIGYGKSDKPAINYGWIELSEYLEAFIKKLNLNNVTLVMHDLGGALGLHYAWKNPQNVKAMAYLEAAVPPAYPRVSFASFGPTELLFRQLRDPVSGRKLLMEDNFWVENFLPASIMRDLAPAEMETYRAPFKTVESRKAIFDMVQSFPIEGKPEREWTTYAEMVKWWKTNTLPKLVMYGSPSRVTPRAGVDWAVENLKNVDVAWVGHGIHFLQEDNPEGIGRAIAEWLRRQLN